MKFLVVVIILAVIIGGISLFGLKTFKQKIESALSTQSTTSFSPPSPTPTSPAVKRTDEALFVPYWSIQGSSSLPSAYKSLVYFGIQASRDGVDKDDDGYRNVSLFADGAGIQDMILAVRMIDSTTNFAILKDNRAQQTLIQESLQIAEKYHFKGVLLNIEVSALPFPSLVDQITAFNQKFAAATHKAGLTYAITAYGDTFYRVRPFDMKKLAKEADSVYIMAYDFHKAKGNPGPNFPLGGKDTFGYDYSTMVDNFADAVPLTKLTVVFGMYGYDWEVDDTGVAQEVGSAVSLKEVKATILDSCKHLLCEWERDTAAGETKATYTDDSKTKHIVWFEDEESVKRKEDFLKNRGVGSFAYWAYSYF